MAKNKKSFKELTGSLEDKIKQLENPNIELEDSVKLYDEAITIYKECKNRLADMEGYLSKITRSASGDIEVTDFKA